MNSFEYHPTDMGEGVARGVQELLVIPCTRECNDLGSQYAKTERLDDAWHQT